MAKGGSLIIETLVDNSKFEKQLEKLENRLKNAKLDLEVKAANVEKAKRDLEQANATLRSLKDSTKENADALKGLQTEYDLFNKKIEAGENLTYQEYTTYKTLQLEIEQVKKEQESLNKTLDKANEKVNVANDNLTKAENLYKKNLSKVTELRQEIEQLKNSQGVAIDLKGGFDKLYKSAKKLAMGIIGVRASYSLVRKMASSYLADNEETANRISNLWTGLGVLMGNVIEGIVGLLRKAVTAILYFASVLTNVNYIAKANEAILKKQTKATAGLRKEQNKLNASFDEAEVLQDNSSASGGITAGGPVELFNVEELGNAKKVIEGLATKLKPVWEIIKGIVNFALEHPSAIIAILGGLKLIDFLNKIIGISRAGSAGAGLAGILTTLQALVAIGTIVISIKILDNLDKETKELSNTMSRIREDGKNLHDEFLKDEKDINKVIQNSNTKRENSLELLGKQNTYGVLLKNTESEVLETIKETARQIDQNIQKEIELYNQGGKNSEVQERIRDEIYDQYQYNLRVIEALQKRGQDTSEIEKLNENLVQSYKDMGGKIEEANGKMTILKKNSKVTAELDLDTKKAEAKSKSFWNTFTEPFRELFSGISSALGIKKSSKGADGRAKGGIYYPKLALGGIISQPGRGVPYHGATIGERGAEAV